VEDSMTESQQDGFSITNLKNKKLLLIGGLFFLLFLGLSAALLLRAQSKNSQIDDSKNVDIQKPSGGNYLYRNPALEGENNPLVSDTDLTKAREKYAEDAKKLNVSPPTTPISQYKYKLAPQLKTGAKSSSVPFKLVKDTFAAGCAQTTAPAIVDVYKLKTHVDKEFALTVAHELNIDATLAFATPSLDGGFSYYITDPKNPGNYIIISEANGNFLYHHPVADAGIPIDAAMAKDKATSIAKSYSFVKNLLFLETLEHTQTPTNAFSTKLTRSWGSYEVVNRTAIDNLTATESVCDIKPAVDANSLLIDAAIDGIVTNVSSKVKIEDKAIKLSSISLEESLKENPDSLIVPMTFDEGTTMDLINDVTINESYLARIDVGVDMAQCAYVPTYITSGTTPSGMRVIAVFPAVSAKDLKTLCDDPKKTNGTDSKEGEASHSTVQYKTYTVPTPTLLPVPTGGFEKCYGNQIDYLVDCRDLSNNTCNVFMGVPYREAADDPFNVCKEGPVAPEEHLYSKPGGIDVCRQVFVDVNERLVKEGKKPIPLDNYQAPTTLMPSADVICHFAVNPC